MKNKETQKMRTSPTREKRQRSVAERREMSPECCGEGRTHGVEWSTE